MELPYPAQTLTTELHDEIEAFYGSVFGWKGFDTDVVGPSCRRRARDAEEEDCGSVTRDGDLAYQELTIYDVTYRLPESFDVQSMGLASTHGAAVTTTGRPLPSP